ncbi:MAG: arylamine N-acetyltransferase, partial [Actinomycetota bacterium]
DGDARYRLSLDPRSLDDFDEGNHHQQTSPDSHFTHNTVCSLATDGGRVTIRGRQLIETVGDDRTETELGADQLGPALADRFGIELSAAEVGCLHDAN